MSPRLESDLHRDVMLFAKQTQHNQRIWHDTSVIFTTAGRHFSPWCPLVWPWVCLIHDSRALHARSKEWMAGLGSRQPWAHICCAVWMHPDDSPEPPLSLRLHWIYTSCIVLCCRAVYQNDNRPIKAATSHMQFWITQRRWTHSLHESWQIGYHLLWSLFIFRSPRELLLAFL